MQTEQEYFFPVYGGEPQVVWASSQEEAEKKFTKGETAPAPLKDEITTEEYE